MQQCSICFVIYSSAGTGGKTDQLAIGQASTSASDSMALVVADSAIPGRRDLQKTSGGSSKDKGSKSDDRPHHKKKKKKVPSGPKGPQVRLPFFVFYEESCRHTRGDRYVKLQCHFVTTRRKFTGGSGTPFYCITVKLRRILPPPSPLKFFYSC